MQDYHNLRVWRLAVARAMNTRRAVSYFPRSGYSELKAQMVSSTESTAQNIVEGCGAATQREFARYLDISIKSANELEGGYDLAHTYEIVPAKQCRTRSGDTIALRRQLYSLRKMVLDSPDDGETPPPT